MMNLLNSGDSSEIPQQSVGDVLYVTINDRLIRSGRKTANLSFRLGRVSHIL